MIKNLLLLFFCFSGLFSIANDSIYVNRQSDYIATALLNNSGNIMALQAKYGIQINQNDLDEILTELPSKYTADFDIVELVRVLFYSDSLYDDDILPVLEDIPFWLNEGDTIRNYWTENHMIMWMSSEWLLHERYGWSIDNTLRTRLIHYLELKKEYGFYEFYSSTYAPYTLSGLLNLYDFTEDPELKELAKEVAQLLLEDLLRPATSLGVYNPAAGRNYPEKYRSAYGQNHSSLIFLLTGFGETPSAATHAGAFLALSDLPVTDVINSWSSTLDVTVHVGHPIENSAEIHSELTARDRLIFEWSASAYAHPSIIERTFEVLRDSSIWAHKDWAAIRPLSSISPESAPALSETLKVLTYSSVISNYDLNLFKNNEISLMSIANTWKGKIGFQQWPVAATIGTTAVYTGSGEVKSNWGQRDRNIGNTHMPHVEQKNNLALVMYRPEPIPDLLELAAGDQFANNEVALFWQNNEYDEVVEDGPWLIGRQDENYVAVRRSCSEIINTWWACETFKGQTWVIMVGDASMYDNFTNFQNLISASKFSENWYYNESTSQSVYQAQIIVDETTLEYAWGIDSEEQFSNSKEFIEPLFSVYPNPSEGNITLNFNQNKPVNVRVFSTLGTEVFNEDIAYDPVIPNKINTESWQEGLYLVVLESEGKRYTQKLVKH